MLPFINMATCFQKSLVKLSYVFIVLALISSLPVAHVLGQDSEDTSGTEINVKNADLGAIVRVFSKKTKRNYILDESVKGKVTIYLPAKVSDSESVRILEAILSLKGFTSVPIGDNLWKIIPSKDARQATIPTVTDAKASLRDRPSAAVVTRLVRLKFVSADDMQKLLQQLVSSSGVINSYSRTNSLLIIDSEDNVERLIDIVRSVDIPSSDQDMTIIPVKHADAAEVADTIKLILGSEDSSGPEGSGSVESPLDLIRQRLRQGSQAANAANNAANLANQQTQGVSIVAAGLQPKVIPDQRTNSIIVVADETDTARIRALIQSLDSEVDLSGNRFYVYRCQHASAEELSDVLGGLVGQGGSSRSSNNSSDILGSSGFSGSSDTNSRRSNSFGSTSGGRGRLDSQRRSPGQSRRGNQSQGASTVSLGDDLSITADPSTNSLIIAASKSDYEKILELLTQLDIKRRQVLVEAVLLEVAVNDSERFSTEFLTSAGGADGGLFGSANFDNLGTLLSDPTRLSDFSVAAASSGTLTLPGDITIPTQAVLVTAAQANSNVNVLSSPNILATDNESAEIVVGQNVPFISSTSSDSTNLSNTFNQVDRQDVGITLRITPQISSGDSVTLNIFTEVSSVVEATQNSTLGPTTTLRTSETTIIAKDGQMIVIGGLISDDISSGNRGIPFLKDIPIIGAAFRQTSENHQRRNLLIFITPRVIKDQFDNRDVTVAKRDLMDNTIGSEDLYPDRQDVLHSFDIDQVAEAKKYEGPKPSSIRVPSRHHSADSEQLGRMSESLKFESMGHPNVDRHDFDESLEIDPLAASIPNPSNTGKLISLKSNPKLPLQKPAQRLKESRQTTSNHSTFVVLENIEGQSADLPFQLEQGKAIVTLPQDSQKGAKLFFEAGRIYAYKSGNQVIDFRVLGVFRSDKEIKQSYPELQNNWYTLSPYEIMNLGSEPWIAK